MKKTIIFSILFLGLSFFACDPLDDIFDELENKYTGPTEYTLAEEDYLLSDNENVRNFGSFSESDPPNSQNMGSILNRVLKEGDDGLLIEVSYLFFFPLNLETILEYTVLEEEYPGDFPNFGSTSEIVTFLTNKYPDAERGFVSRLTYDFFTGSEVETQTNDFVNLGMDLWKETYTLTEDDYVNNLGQRFANFGSEDDAKFYLPPYASQIYPFAEVEERAYFIYHVFESGEVTPFLMELEYDGSKWSIIESTNLQTGKYVYSEDEKGWAEKPFFIFTPTEEQSTKSYTMTDDDYVAGIGNDSFFNYDVFLSDEEVYADIGFILNSNFDDISDGDVFAVTYDQYNGSFTETKTVNLKASL